MVLLGVSKPEIIHRQFNQLGFSVIRIFINLFQKFNGSVLKFLKNLIDQIKIHCTILTANFLCQSIQSRLF